MSKIVWIVAIILMIMATATLASAAEDIKQNKITEKFQRLSDLPLFNNTDLIPRYIIDNALVPDRFYSSMKKININQIANNKNKYNIPDKRIRPNISPNQYPSDNIIFSSNASIIWKRSITGGLSYSQVVDDLNGDSLKDILTVEYKYNIDTDTYTYILRAAKGTGQTIWSTSIIGSNVWLYGYQVGDVDGDGLNDIIVKTYDSDNIETLKIKKGTTGTTLWQQSAANGFVYAIPIKDLSGDGLNDVLEATYDYDTGIMKLKAKKGNTGTTLWQESIKGGIYGNSAGDLSGDEINDVLVQIYDYDTGVTTLKAKKGATGTTLWQESFKEGINAIPVKDLNGDGLNDVLVQIFDSGKGITTLKAKKGITGTNLWTNSITNGVLDGIPAGDLNGDRLNDILVLTFNFSSNVGTIKAKKGTTGTTLWQDIYKGEIFGMPVNDLNGDGLNDVLVTIYEPGINTVKAKKGITGTNLWQTTSTDSIFPYQIGDIDGDSLNDIALDTYISDTNADSLKIKKGKTGVTLWSKNIRGGFIYAMPAGDLNKDGKNDLLLQLYKGGYNAILANKGNNGENMWKAESYTYISLGYYDPGIGTDPVIGPNSGMKYDLNGDNQNDVLMNIFNEIYLVMTKS